MRIDTPLNVTTTVEERHAAIGAAVNLGVDKIEFRENTVWFGTAFAPRSVLADGSQAVTRYIFKSLNERLLARIKEQEEA